MPKPKAVENMFGVQPDGDAIKIGALGYVLDRDQAVNLAAHLTAAADPKGKAVGKLLGDLVAE